MSRVAISTVIVLSVLVGVYTVWQLRAAAVLFVLSLAMAASLRPIISWLARNVLPYMAALTITYLVVFAALAVLMFAAGGPLLVQVQGLGDDSVRAYQTLYDRLHNEGRHGSLAASLPPPEDLFAALAGEQGRALLQSVLGATLTVFGMAVDLVIVVFLGIYWSIDQVYFERLWLSLLPLDRRRAARDVWRAIETELGAYVRSEGIQSIAAGILLWLGYLALGQPYPVLLAMIGAVAWLIPWVGVLVAVAGVVLLSAPSLVLAPSQALTPLLLSVAFTSVLLLILQRYVEPRFFDRRRYNALVTAVIIFGMADVAGIMGLVFGAPLAAALQIAGRHWVRSRVVPTAPETPAANGSLAARLEALRGALARQKRPAPELASLVDRLGALVEGAADVLDDRLPEEAPISRLVVGRQGS
ncbi:MAG TPA: AI-2E family transporter [Pirellulales bacterium]|nr:AI-2E family transporter [Pirellulales bacterium]